MSGTFNELDVPPTLVSFAVDIGDQKEIITPELKEAGNQLMLLTIEKDEYDLPVYEQLKALYGAVYEDIKAGRIVSAYEVERHGVAEAVTKMAFGNKLGVSLNETLTEEELFAPGWCNLVVETPKGASLMAGGRMIGQVTEEAAVTYKEMTLPLEELLTCWTSPLEKVFPTRSGVENVPVDTPLYKAESVHVCRERAAKPTVFIPVFPGTNCEYDSARAFERAGANVVTKVFKNLTAEDIRESVGEFERAIGEAQIIMFPGGFSAGDEPEGSAKFFANAFRNEKMKEAIDKLLNKRDGLILGICNGFQALIKLGLVPYGQIQEQTADSPTLTYNTIGRHISKMVYTKVVTNKSPWLLKAQLGGTYCIPASHGEGRFVASEEWIKKLFDNGQVATQYVNLDGQPTMDEEWNPNGSYYAIEGITSPDGRILGKMGHSERRGEAVAINIYGEQDMKLFESGVEYFK